MRRCFRMRKSVSHACRKGSRKVSSLARGAWQLYSSRVAEPNRSGLRAREGERLWRHGAWFLNWCWRAHCGRGWVGHASNVIRKININMYYNLIIIYLDFLARHDGRISKVATSKKQRKPG